MRLRKRASAFLTTMAGAYVLTAFAVIFSSALVQAGDTEKLHEKIDLKGVESLEVKVDIDAGELRIGKGAEAHTFVGTLNYTADKFEGAIDYKVRDKTGRLRVKLDKKGWFDWKDDCEGGLKARADLELPEDVLLDLDVDLKAGEEKLHLGGLNLEHLSVGLWAGELDLSFDEPKDERRDLMVHDSRMYVDVHVGEIRLKHLGNAPFEKLIVDGGIGELTADFSGDINEKRWAKLDMDIGEIKVFLPRDVGVKVKISRSPLSSISVSGLHKESSRYYYSDNYGETDGEWNIEISMGIGSVEVVKRE